MILTEQNGLLVTESGTKFRRIFGAFGWLDPTGEAHEAEHAFIAGGHREDGKGYHILEEKQGSLPELLRYATDAKDRLLFTEIWTDCRDKGLLAQINDYDGLCTYHPQGEEKGVMTYHDKTPGQTWPNFRNHEHVAGICAVAPNELTSVTASLDRVARVNQVGQLLIVPDCETVAWVLSPRTMTEIIKHPMARALAWLIWTLETFNEDRPASQIDAVGFSDIPERIR